MRTATKVLLTKTILNIQNIDERLNTGVEWWDLTIPSILYSIRYAS